MRRFRTLSLPSLLILAGACADTAGEVLAPEVPSYIAVHEGEGAQISLDADDILVQRNGMQVTITLDWEDDQAWDQVSFSLSRGSTKLETDWTLKPYAGNVSQQFSFTETLPQAGSYRYCVEVMAKNKSGKGTPTTTHHARECVDVVAAEVPAAPSELTGWTSRHPSVDSRMIVNLAWRDNSNDETHWQIEGLNISNVVTYGRSGDYVSAQYNFAGVGVTYTIRVRACNANGCSAPSNEITLTTPS